MGKLYWIDGNQFSQGRCEMQIQRAGRGTTGIGGASRGRQALNRTNNSLKKILERLATGQRINRASDDAAGLSISEQLRTQIRGFKMASRNVADAMSALNIADGTANETTAILQRQRELTIQARNDTLTDDQRQILDTEYQQLSEELNRIAGSSQFNRQNVADGTDLADGDGEIQAGPNAGAENVVALPEIDISADGLGITPTSIESAASAENALSVIDTALNNLGTQRSQIGATVNRFESIQNNLDVASVNTQAAESVLRDQDMASGISELTRQRLLQEGGMAAFSRFQEISASHLLGLLQ